MGSSSSTNGRSPQTHAELRTPLRTAHRAVHHQRQRQLPECRPDGSDRRHNLAPASSSLSTRTGRRASVSPTASPTRRCFAAARASTTIPNQTNSYTFLNTNPPWATIFNCNWSTGLPTLNLSNPFAVPAACPLAGANPSGLIVTPPWDQPTGRMNQWSASLDRQFWNGGGLELQYLGSHSYHLDRSYYNNTPLPGPGPVNSRRPNKNFGGPIRTINNDLIANYESMSAIFRQRMRKGSAGQVSYTWAHTLDVNTDSNGGGTPMNPYYWKADYGNSNWDIRHRVVATFVYDIPFFSGANPLLKTVFANWQANGIVTMRSGLAVQRQHRHRHRQYRLQRHLPAEPGQDADRQLRPRPPGRLHRRDAPSRSPICIRRTRTNFAYGNAGRNILRGPGAQRSTSRSRRTSRSASGARFQFRFETFGSVQPRELRESVVDDQHFVVSGTSPAPPATATSSLEANFRSKGAFEKQCAISRPFF